MRGETPTSVVIGRISSVRAAVGAPLVDRDLLADEVLVDRVRGLLDVRARDGVLDRLVAVADRERELHLVLDAGEEDVALARLELLRVLLRVGQRAQLVLELRADRALDGREPLRLEQHLEAVPHLRLAHDVVLARVHRDRGRLVGEQLVDDRRRPRAGRPRRSGGRSRRPAAPSSSAFSSTSIHFGLPTSRASSSIASQMRMISECASANASSIVSSGTWSPPASIIVSASRVPTTTRSSEDSSICWNVGLTTSSPSIRRDAHGADRAEERQRRDRERRRGAVDREDVVRHDHVGGEHGADHLHLVLEALRPERPDRAVDHARGERRALGGAALPLEEAAGDLPGGVHPLLDVDRQREEVRVGARVVAPDGRREDHRVAASDDDRAVRLLRELARLEAQLCRAHVDGHRGLMPGGNGAHTLSCPFTLPLWRKVEV